MMRFVELGQWAVFSGNPAGIRQVEGAGLGFDFFPHGDNSSCGLRFIYNQSHDWGRVFLGARENCGEQDCGQ